MRLEVTFNDCARASLLDAVMMGVRGIVVVAINITSESNTTTHHHHHHHLQPITISPTQP
jgi:hypothetical protein